MQMVQRFLHLFVVDHLPKRNRKLSIDNFDNFLFLPYHWQDARFDLIIVNAMRFHCKPSNRLKFGLDLDTESMNGVAHPGLFQTGMPTQRGVPTYYLAKCLQKIHANERILTVRDVLAPSWIRHWNE